MPSAPYSIHFLLMSTRFGISAPLALRIKANLFTLILSAVIVKFLYRKFSSSTLELLGDYELDDEHFLTLENHRQQK